MILRSSDGSETEYLWQLPVDLGRADPIALNIGRFHDRRWPRPIARENHRKAKDGQWHGAGGLSPCRLEVDDMDDWCEHFASLTRGVHLVGAVVSFDEERLRRLLRNKHQAAMWHYHLVDVETLAVGWLAAGHDPAEGGPVGDKCQPPWDSEELSLAVGVDPTAFDRHTALGDARWAAAIYDAVIGGRA